jgi:HPr kinase/phosphorylase
MNEDAQGRVTVTVSEFLEAGRERLGLELIGGSAGLGRVIHEAAMNRPGLALTGFFQYFAHRRIQILGHAESAYLASLNQTEREERLGRVFGQHIPCLIIARKRKVPPEIERLAKETSTPVLRTPLITMHFINAATILMENLMAPRMNIQGTMVEIHGMGVLIEGKSGIGKSETALALIKRGHSLVADDVTAFRRDSSGAVIGAPVGVTRYHMEIRGLGIIHVPSLFGVGSVRGEKELDLVIHLSAGGEEYAPASFDGVSRARDVLGVAIPCVPIPLAPGRDVTNLVEAAALDQKLKRLGHDAAKELDERLKAVLTDQKGEA